MVSIWLLNIGWADLGIEIASKSWPSVEGKIMRAELSEITRTEYNEFGGTSSIVEKVTRYTPRISYQYTVNGKTYTGNQLVPLGEYTTKSYSAARIKMDRYAKGKTVKVFYNPSHPDNVALEPGITNLSFKSIGAALFIMVLGIGLIVVSLRHK